MMESESVTTPFGRRSMTLGMIASQMTACEIEPGRTIDKWKIYRALCEAKPLLGITDRALAVLNALLSFYPRNELSADHGLVVFPSNSQLSLRAHGMAEQTIRRHLAVLVGAGLLIRKDSPNGKRFARRGRGGDVSEAFGFSIAPLLSRSDEIEALAATVVAERLHLQRLRERISLCRRDIIKLIETAYDEQLPGDWDAVHAQFRHMVESVSRSPEKLELESTLDEMTALKENIINCMETNIKTRKQSGNPYQNERHIQNSNPDSYSESEPSFEAKQDGQAERADKPGNTAAATVPIRMSPLDNQNHSNANREKRGEGASLLKAFPLGLVLQACPAITDYAAGGSIANWRELMSAAVVVRSMLGVSPSAYEQACVVMGAENAATVVACILERGGHISSAGGYLRDLTLRAERGEFSIGPMLMALARGRNVPGQLSA